MFSIRHANDGATSGGTPALNVLRVAKMAKMFRISRMARLLRQVPELMVLLKGIGAASRTVTVFSALWLIIVYVFAVVFRQLTVNYAYNDTVHNFSSVTYSMNTLLLNGILPAHQGLVDDVAHANWIL